MDPVVTSLTKHNFVLSRNCVACCWVKPHFLCHCSGLFNNGNKNNPPLFCSQIEFCCCCNFFPIIVCVVLHRKRVGETCAEECSIYRSAWERNKATVTKGHKTLVLYCNPLNFTFNSLTLSKTRRKECCRKEHLECVLPKIRIDAFTWNVIVWQKVRSILREESRAAELVRGSERGWTRNTRAVQSVGGVDESLNFWSGSKKNNLPAVY